MALIFAVICISCTNTTTENTAPPESTLQTQETKKKFFHKKDPVTGKYGITDEQGNEITPCKYEGLIISLKSDGKGNLLQEVPFSEGFARVQLAGKWGFINQSGIEVIPCKYDEVQNFFEGFADVQLAGKWGRINQSGIEVIPCKYDEVENFSKGLARVQLAGKWGWIDSTGTEVIPCIYDEIIENFRGGKAKVILNGKKQTIKKP